MVATPLERKAAFKAAVVLHTTTAGSAARDFGVSLTHLMLVLAGERVGSERLEQAIAEFIGRPRKELFALRTPPPPEEVAPAASVAA